MKKCYLYNNFVTSFAASRSFWHQQPMVRIEEPRQKQPITATLGKAVGLIRKRKRKSYASGSHLKHRIKEGPTPCSHTRGHGQDLQERLGGSSLSKPSMIRTLELHAYSDQYAYNLLAPDAVMVQVEKISGVSTGGVRRKHFGWDASLPVTQ
eukprot:1160831-Pelagomonas_calceolata.AAC.5